MSSPTATSATTLIDELRTSFAGCLRCPEGVAAPVAILWTDLDGQWSSLIETLQAELPQLYRLGAYEPTQRTGPVIWLKCVIDRALPEVSPPDDVVPILYLPHVDRQQLRNVGECPEAWQPLVELQFRGNVWAQRNGRDWTLEAFLTSADGLGLDVSLDNVTKQAVQRALPLLAKESLNSLRGRRLEAEDFDRLCIGDPVRDLLSWMSDPERFQQACETARWQTFCNVAKREFDLDPEATGAAVAGRMLREGGGKWDGVWQRFTEAPKVYRGLSALLGGKTAKSLLMADGRDPSLNAKRETALREALTATVDLPHHTACDRVLALEQEHQERRRWVWTQLGESPLAIVLEPLAKLAQAAKIALGGDGVAAVIQAYVSEGWQCDRAALESLAKVSNSGDASLIAAVVRALYEPWLRKAAQHFQSLVGTEGAELRKLVSGTTAEPETCLLFADGLRFDVAGLLKESLETRGLRVSWTHRIAPLPTVTATAKPLASPVHAALCGDGSVADFTPVIRETGQSAVASRLRDLMTSAGVTVIDPADCHAPEKKEQGGWSEIGQLDKLGHSLGARLAREIDREVEAIAERVNDLLNCGWPRVKVVTDHGWLLLPGGLPKVDLPRHLVATKWSRCAAVQGQSMPDVPTCGWYWESHVRIASPPDISSFAAGTEYSHGGISVQECVVPELLIERSTQRVQVQIKAIHWRGLRCRVTVETNTLGLKVDLRLNGRQPASSIVAAVKEIGANGECSLTVTDEDHEGAAACLVVLDLAGQVLEQQVVKVGDES